MRKSRPLRLCSKRKLLQPGCVPRGAPTSACSYREHRLSVTMVTDHQWKARNDCAWSQVLFLRSGGDLLFEGKPKLYMITFMSVVLTVGGRVYLCQSTTYRSAASCILKLLGCLVSSLAGSLAGELFLRLGIRFFSSSCLPGGSALGWLATDESFVSVVTDVSVTPAHQS